MRAHAFASQVKYANPLALATGVTDLINDRTPDESLFGIRWLLRLAADSQDRADRLVRVREITPTNEDDGRRAVTWDVSAGRVDHVREIDLLREEFLDEPLTELAF